MTQYRAILDGNEAVASVAFRLNEVIAIFPITPSSPMGEWADQWKEEGRKNIWGVVPRSSRCKAKEARPARSTERFRQEPLGTTFTASQGLLLMIPNMYKIAGELTPAVIHVAARTVATHALSIFGDHSDVMATRPTGFALLSSNSVQEASDFALIAQAATLESPHPVPPFFRWLPHLSRNQQDRLRFRTKILRALIDDAFVRQHRGRALSPDHPVLRGTAQNPDVFFQAREAVQSLLPCLPRHRAERDGSFRRANRKQLSACSTMWAPPMPSASSS